MILIDTNILLPVADLRRHDLSPLHQQALQDAAGSIFVSIASLWGDRDQDAAR